MMRATYNGKEAAVEIFGAVFPRGHAVEVTDPHAIEKLGRHPEFTCDVAASLPGDETPRRRGRPPKVHDGENQG